MKIYSNKKSTKYLYLIVILISFVSCEDFFETTLELEIPDYEEQVVISAVMDNIDRQGVLLTHTVGINEETRDNFVENAAVKLSNSNGMVYNYVPEEDHRTYNSDPNYILNDFIEFVPGETYTLEITTSNGQVVKAKSQMPLTPELVSAKYRENGGTSIEGEKLEAIDVVFKDMPGVENFYRVKLSYKEGGLNSIYLDSNDPAAEESADYISLILSDSQFDGEEYRLQILFSTFSTNQEFDVSKIVLEFIGITEDQYRFDKILSNFYDNNDNPFNSATQLYTNVENGIGLFTIENAVKINIEE